MPSIWDEFTVLLSWKHSANANRILLCLVSSVLFFSPAVVLWMETFCSCTHSHLRNKQKCLLRLSSICCRWKPPCCGWNHRLCRWWRQPLHCQTHYSGTMWPWRQISLTAVLLCRRTAILEYRAVIHPSSIGRIAVLATIGMANIHAQ